MPEIWLRYGTTDIVLDIKFENLLKHIFSTFPLLTEEEVKLALRDVVLTDNMLIIALYDSKAVARTISMLVEMTISRGFSKVTVETLPMLVDPLRTNLADSSIIINQINYHSLQERIKKFDSTIFVSQTIYDPLFGFSCTPTLLLRNFMREQMSEAFNARKDNIPNPGIEGQPLQIALSACQDIHATSIEVISNSFGIAAIYCGNIAETLHKAIKKLISVSLVELEEISRSVIISTSSEIGPHQTLARSLNSLWNSIKVVKDNGSIILLAENLKGIGGGALEMFVEGRLKTDQLDKKSLYIDGLEHILFIRELQQKCQLGIVSTLPRYYSKTKLGLRYYTSVKNGLGELLVKYGKNHKILILSDADITLMKPKL